MFYKREDEKRMIEDIEKDIKKGMKIYSYYPVKGGWIYHSGLFCIHSMGSIKQFFENKNIKRR